MRTLLDDDTVAEIGQLGRLGVRVRWREFTVYAATATIVRYRGDAAWRGTWLDLFRPGIGDVADTRRVLAAVFATLTDPEAPWQSLAVDGHEFDLITITILKEHDV